MNENNQPTVRHEDDDIPRENNAIQQMGEEDEPNAGFEMQKGALVGGAGGAVLGATAGAVVGPPGMLIGAVMGGALGALVGGITVGVANGVDSGGSAEEEEEEEPEDEDVRIPAQNHTEHHKRTETTLR